MPTTSLSQTLAESSAVTAKDAKSNLLSAGLLSQQILRLDFGDSNDSKQSSTLGKILATVAVRKDERLGNVDDSSAEVLNRQISLTEEEGGMVELDSALADTEGREREVAKDDDDDRRSTERDETDARPQWLVKTMNRRVDRTRINDTQPTDRVTEEGQLRTNTDLVLEESAWREPEEQGGMIELLAGDQTTVESSRMTDSQIAAVASSADSQIQIDRGIGMHQAFQLADEAIAEIGNEYVASDDLAADEDFAVFFELADDESDEVVNSDEPATEEEPIGAAALSPLIAAAGISFWLQHKRSTRKAKDNFV